MLAFIPKWNLTFPLLNKYNKIRFIQNHFSNGWTHGHYVNCIFVFAADGHIRICVINTQGYTA